MNTRMYRDYAKIAREEGFEDIAVLFDQAAKIERGHQMRYTQLEKNIEEDKVFKKDQPVVWECRNLVIACMEKLLLSIVHSVAILKDILNYLAIIINQFLYQF